MAPIRPSDSAPGLMDRRRECGVLDRFVDGVRAGEGRALVMRGEPGVGKTVLLEYLIGRAAGCRVVRAVGVQSEMELAFAGLHQLSAARLLEPLDTALARETHLEALTAAVFVGQEFMPDGVREAAEAALAAPPAAAAPRPVDVVLDAYALLLTEGFVVAGPALRRALDVLVALDAGTSDGRRWLFLAGGRAGITIAMDLCDWESMQTLAAGQAQAARDVGALVQLRTAMIFLAATHIMRGELGAAGRLIGEERLIADVTGTPPVSYAAMMLAAWRGREQEATELIEATVREAATRDQGFSADFADCAAAVLYNAQGRYGDACDAARRVVEHQVVGLGAFAAPELAEAAARTGEVALVRTALAWLSERIRVTPTEWALGMQARARALHTGDEAGYLESIEQLARTGGRVQFARSHLVYGEWLSRENRRLDARVQLRTAYDMLADMGADGFAERARRELQAIGDTVRRRTAETVSDLTEQEAHIARLAVDGGTNAEIGAQLFLSARTVEWHLRKVYTKLGVRSRRELGQALATGGRLPAGQGTGPGSFTGAPGRLGVSRWARTVKPRSLRRNRRSFSTERDVVSLPRHGDAAHGVPGHDDHPRSGRNPGAGRGRRPRPRGRPVPRTCGPGAPAAVVASAAAVGRMAHARAVRRRRR